MLQLVLKSLTLLRNDERGASLLEYSILIGLITVVAIVTISDVGTWVGEQWTALEGKLNPPEQ